MSEEKLKDLFELLFNDDLSISGKRELQEYIENLQDQIVALDNVNDKLSSALNSAEQRINKAIEYVEDYKDQWCRNDEVISDMNELLSILKGEDK